MKFFELQEILDEELKDPEFRAGFEAEKKVLAAERSAYWRLRLLNTRKRPKIKNLFKIKRAGEKICLLSK